VSRKGPIKLFSTSAWSFFKPRGATVQKYLSLAEMEPIPGLGPDEYALLSDDRLFLTKQRLSMQVVELLGSCVDVIRPVVVDSAQVLPQEVLDSVPKISRGENYLGRPWTLLDYPRVFSKSDCFAFRTLCWWGQGFGCTLHLSGRFVDALGSIFCSQGHLLADKGFSMGVNPDPWRHSFDHENYRPLIEIKSANDAMDDFVQRNGFLKLHRFLPLENWSQIQAFSKDTFSEIALTLKRGQSKI
jgi:hypothetical protein